MTAVKRVSFPLTEQEKQLKPMEGETSPENALFKARSFSHQEKIKLKRNKSLSNKP